MGDVRRQRYPLTRLRYRKKTDDYVQQQSCSIRWYVCKLHHPDAAEMEQVRAELAAGQTKKAVAVAHNLGTDQRLRRLLAKDAPPREAVSQDPELAPATLSDADVEALLVAVGWA